MVFRRGATACARAESGTGRRSRKSGSPPAEPRRRTFSLAPAAAILEPGRRDRYGTQRREAITGSVSTVSAAAATFGVVTNVDQMIQARAAGVEVTRNRASRAPARRS